LLHGSGLTPAAIVASSYRRKLRKVEDLLDLLSFAIKCADIPPVPEVPPLNPELLDEERPAATEERNRMVVERKMAVIAHDLQVASRDMKNGEYSDTFELALDMYLRCAGHPPDAQGIVSEHDFEQQRDDPLCRANLLLRGLTETTMLPLTSDLISVSSF
jgi:hypothetical protein